MLNRPSGSQNLATGLSKGVRGNTLGLEKALTFPQGQILLGDTDRQIYQQDECPATTHSGQQNECCQACASFCATSLPSRPFLRISRGRRRSWTTASASFWLRWTPGTKPEWTSGRGLANWRLIYLPSCHSASSSGRSVAASLEDFILWGEPATSMQSNINIIIGHIGDRQEYIWITSIRETSTYLLFLSDVARDIRC